jgi:hypothetical protein
VLLVATNPEQVQAVTTRGGRATRDPPYPKGARKALAVPPVAEGENNNEVDQGVLPQEPQEQEMRQDFHGTNYISS